MVQTDQASIQKSVSKLTAYARQLHHEPHFVTAFWSVSVSVCSVHSVIKRCDQLMGLQQFGFAVVVGTTNGLQPIVSSGSSVERAFT